MWAMGYTAANGQLQLSGGATGFDLVGNFGYSYDPASGTWTNLPGSNNINYRGGSACGFYRIGGSTLGLDPENVAEQLPGYGSCGVTGAPWLSESHHRNGLRHELRRQHRANLLGDRAGQWRGEQLHAQGQRERAVRAVARRPQQPAHADRSEGQLAAADRHGQDREGSDDDC